PRRARTRRFSLHSRLALTTTVVLLGGGALLFAAMEPHRAEHSLFMSAAARTAGFDTTSVSELSSGALMTLMLLMFIGASPGSTGGGIKTTTLALMILLVVSILKGRERVTVHGREIPRDLLRRMFAVFVSALLVVVTGIFAIVVLEGVDKLRFLPLAFEVVSAFGTVGLSTGITPDLAVPSKILLCVIMFIGRVGSLSLFLVLVREETASHVRYPEERVMIG
ncbi:MAG: potassium transporter TrkG, partial [Planctomycetota bacterium]